MKTRPPIVLLLSLLFVGAVGAAASWHSRTATQNYLAIMSEKEELQKKIDATRSAREQLQKRIGEASDLEKWALGSMPLQPLVVEVIRSIGPASTIVDLSIVRDPEVPSQLQLALTLRGEDETQINKTLAAINSAGYREFSRSQAKVNGGIECRATLRWRTDITKPTPQDRGKQIVQP